MADLVEAVIFLCYCLDNQLPVADYDQDMADGQQPQTTEAPHTEAITQNPPNLGILDRLRPPDGAGQGALSQGQMDQKSNYIKDMVVKMRIDDAARQQQVTENDNLERLQQLEKARKLMDRNLNLGRALSNLGVEDSSVFIDALKGKVDAQTQAQEILNRLKKGTTFKNNQEFNSLERKLEAARVRSLTRLEKDRHKQLNKSLNSLPLPSTDAAVIRQALSGDSAATPRARELLASLGENPTAISLSQELFRPQTSLESSLPSSVNYDVGPILAPSKDKALEVLKNAMNQAGAEPPQELFEIRKLLRLDPDATAFDRQDFENKVASLKPLLLDPNFKAIKDYLDKVSETYPVPKPTPDASPTTISGSTTPDASEQESNPTTPDSAPPQPNTLDSTDSDSTPMSDSPQVEDDNEELAMAARIQDLLSPYLHDAQTIIDSIPVHLNSLRVTKIQIDVLMEVIQEMRESLQDLSQTSEPSRATTTELNEEGGSIPVLSEDGDGDDFDFDENPFPDIDLDEFLKDEDEEPDPESEDLLTPVDTEQIMEKAIDQVRGLINNGVKTAEDLAHKAMDIMSAVKNGLPEDLKKKIKGPVKTAIFSVLVMCAISLVLASTVTSQSS